MVLRLAKFFGACRHRRYSWPHAVAVTVEGEELRVAYVACLSCGAELLYDLEEMKVGGTLDIRGRSISKKARLEASGDVKPLSLV